MAGSWSSPLRLGAILRWALTLSMLWAGFLAPGVMPGPARDGSLTFVLCADGGERLVTLGADGVPVLVGDPSDGPDDPHATVPCSFAASHAAAAPPLGLLWTLPDGTAVAAEAPPAVVAASPLRLAFADHLPRGPPAA